jgi:NhaP-type Na+/H+ or K+/H+ antiporter
VSTTETTTEVRVRRAPRLPVFLVLGAVVGAILTLIATATIGHVDPKVGFGPTFGYFCVFGVPAGIALGALVGLLLDRRSQRRARVVSAEYELVESPPAETSGPSD